MARIEGEISIDKPVGDVFDFVADERNEPRYNPHMVRADKTSPGPIGVGTTFTAQTMARGRPVDMTIEITGYDRPSRLESSTSLSAMNIHGTLTFDQAVPRGTRMRWSWQVEPRGVLKLITPVITVMGKRQEEAIWSGLKELLESEEDAS